MELLTGWMPLFKSVCLQKADVVNTQGILDVYIEIAAHVEMLYNEIHNCLFTHVFFIFTGYVNYDVCLIQCLNSTYAGRVECTMQNVADLLFNKFPSRLMSPQHGICLV